MLSIDYARWGHSPKHLHELALSSTHERTRERFLALYEITQGVNATQVAQRSDRHEQTVMRWVHWYNQQGPDALVYRRSGGHPPLPKKLKQP